MEVIIEDSKVRDFFVLLKPRVMSLVIFTGFVGMLVAPGNVHPLIGFIAILCIAIGSGAAGAINMWYERDIDAVMERTKNRPLPMRRVHPQEALHFAVGLSVASVLVMGLLVNILPATLLAVAILFYVFIYTVWLKRITYQNIVIGGAAGAFPPVIGWVAVTNNLAWEPFILFLIIFLWTPPHFWALSLYKSKDYAIAGIPMLPVVKGDNATKIQILFYTILLAICSVLPIVIGMQSIIFSIGSTLLNLRFVYLSYLLYRQKENKIAPKLFGYSIMYLFAIFTLIMVDHFYKF